MFLELLGNVPLAGRISDRLPNGDVTWLTVRYPLDLVERHHFSTLAYRFCLLRLQRFGCILFLRPLRVASLSNIINSYKFSEHHLPAQLAISIPAALKAVQNLLPIACNVW